jgi:hypothetical protein
VERAIAQESETPSVRGDIPANVTASFRAKIDWHDIRVGCDVLGEGFENAARICDQYAWEEIRERAPRTKESTSTGYRVERTYIRHPTESDHDLVFNRHTPTYCKK